MLTAAKGREAFLDVGVNLGVFTLSALSASYHSVGFEALRYNAELVVASAVRMGASSRLALFKMAVTSSSAVQELCVTSQRKAGTNRGLEITVRTPNATQLWDLWERRLAHTQCSATHVCVP